MPIEQDLKQRLLAAMKAKDLQTANVIRMIKTKVTERKTSKGFDGKVDDALYLDVIGAYRKSLAKAKKEYDALGEKGRASADELDFEINYCQGFLPQPLSEDETRAAVKAAITESGASDAKMAGRVMGMVMKAHKGRAEAGVVKKIVDAELAKN